MCVVTALVTAGVLLVMAGISFWGFVDWLENNEK